MPEKPEHVWPGEAVEAENARTSLGRLYGTPPQPRGDRKPRCSCGKVLAWLVTRPWSIRCDRCGATSGQS